MIRLAYLAAPYSHDSVYVRRRRVRQATTIAARLMQRGIHVYAPTVHGHRIWEAMSHDPGYKFWVAHGLNVLRRCDVLYVAMIEGWEKSSGIQQEILVARECEIGVLYLAPTTCTVVEFGDNPSRGPAVGVRPAPARLRAPNR